MSGLTNQGCSGLQSGAGTSIMLAAVPPDCSEPVAFVATVTPAVVAGATSLALGAALPDGVFLDNEWQLVVDNPSGSQVIITVDGALQTEAGTPVSALTVLATTGDIEDGATICYPQVLRGRESANITSNITRPTSVQLEDNGATSGVTVSSDTTIDLQGNYFTFDAANRNFRLAALGSDTRAPRNVYLWIIDPSPNDLFTHGEVVHGVINPTSFSKSISSTEITKAALAGAVDGRVRFEVPSNTVEGYFGIALLP